MKSKKIEIPLNVVFMKGFILFKIIMVTPAMISDTQRLLMYAKLLLFTPLLPSIRWIRLIQ